MAGRIRQFVVYLKVTLVVAVVLLVAVVVFNNRNYTTRFWPGATAEDVPTLWLMLMTAAASISIFWVLMRVRGVYRELKVLHAQEAEEQRLKAHEQRSSDLEEQERRIDQKLKTALDSPNSNSQGHS
jgi:uncharacterized membrane protein